MRLFATALWAVFLCLPALAQGQHLSHITPGMCRAMAPTADCDSLDAPKKPVAFEELFAPLHAGGCVPIASVRAAGATVTLTPEQFQFVRAFYMAVPPVSHELPPGDHAFVAKDGDGSTVLGLYEEASGEACATFEAPDWLMKLVDEVGRGETGKRGEPL